MNVEIRPYFADGERYPGLIGVRVEGDEYEMAYVSKGELIDALDENTKLRKLMARMAEALGIDCEWADPNWCKTPCRLEFGCWPEDMAIRCPAWAAMRELGIEVDE